MKVNKLYLVSTICLMIILPVISIISDPALFNNTGDFISVTGKWFVFWAIGLRLLSAGIKQVIDPLFTVETIFNLKSKESCLFVRELGLANICMGMAAALSLFIPEWRLTSGFIGGMYIGMAGVFHIAKRPSGINEMIPLITNLTIFLVIILYMTYSFVNRL